MIEKIKEALVFSTLAGLIGYFIVHPGVMVISSFMRGGSGTAAVREGISMSFGRPMLPWSITFFIVGLQIGFLIWYVKEDIRKLEEANELKRLFADIIAHDVSNPLTVAMMKAELLLEKVGSEAEKEELHKIMQRIEDAEALLIKAREYTQVEEMKELDFQEADIGEFIKVVVEDFSSMAKERGQEIRYEEKRVKAMVNPRIKDALSNLLSNAIKYSPPGSVIDIRMEDLEDRVRIAFKDQGEGIPDEYKEAVFGRMKRINREGVKGTGLGLAIVKKIVELHKGRVWVEDNTPKGSVFILELPKRQK